MKTLLLSLLVLASNAAHAALFCPGNEAELRQALTTAATNNEDDEIRLRRGTYYTGGVKFSMTSTEARSLSISGGWADSGPLWCSVQSPSAAATILDGQNITAVLDIYAYIFGIGKQSHLAQRLLEQEQRSGRAVRERRQSVDSHRTHRDVRPHPGVFRRRHQ